LESLIETKHADLRGRETQYLKNPIAHPNDGDQYAKWTESNPSLASRPNPIGFSPDDPVKFSSPMYSRSGEAPINAMVNPEMIQPHPARKGVSLSVSFFQRAE
jgi:hypothetical protein